MSHKNKSFKSGSLDNGCIKLNLEEGGINIYFKGERITSRCGLNSAVNTLGVWTDSGKSEWTLIEDKQRYSKYKLKFSQLPLSQVWTFKWNAKEQVEWNIELIVEEWLHIDELRFLCLINPAYKKWFDNYKEGDFSRFSLNWQDFSGGQDLSYLVGACIWRGDYKAPFICLEPTQKDKQYLSVIQNSPDMMNLHVIGLKNIKDKREKEYSPGRYQIFSGLLTVSDKQNLLDLKVESLRQSKFRRALNKVDKKISRDFSILLANLPWKRAKRVGVRAGSRWPHIKDHSEGNYMPFPFFLAYAVSLLEENRFNVRIVDAIAEDISEDDFFGELSRERVDILVAETSVPSFYHDLRFLRKISELGITVVLCGPNAMIYSQDFLEKNNFIDFVLFGEYELTLLCLVKALQQERQNLRDIDGLIWRDNKGHVLKNKPRDLLDINSLPWPHRESLPMDKYWDLPGDIPYPSAQMVASRGCPFGCSFCLWPQVMYKKKSYRPRDVKDVVDEMEYLIKEQGFKSIYFDDDTFNIGRERMVAICKEIKERGLQSTPWAIMARADLMDEELLCLMKQAGLQAVKYGVESVSKDLLNNCSKNYDFNKSLKMILKTKELGIKCHLTFVFGVDGETKDSIERTIKYSIKLEPDSVQFSVLTPFPGTNLYSDLEKEGRILTKDWSLYDGHNSCVFKPERVSPEQILEAKRRAYKIWADCLRRKRGWIGNIKKFRYYLKRKGFRYVFNKTLGYLRFVMFKRRKYLQQ